MDYYLIVNRSPALLMRGAANARSGVATDRDAIWTVLSRGCGSAAVRPVTRRASCPVAVRFPQNGTCNLHLPLRSASGLRLVYVQCPFDLIALVGSALGAQPHRPHDKQAKESAHTYRGH